MKYNDKNAGVRKLPKMISSRRPEKTVTCTDGGRGRRSAMEYTDEDAGLNGLPREAEALPCCRFGDQQQQPIEPLLSSPP
jgi:hypothetical protein